MNKKFKGPFTIVDNDSGDQYVIPVDKLTHWYGEWMYSEQYESGDTPDYAVYCGGRVTFKAYKFL